jgi:hypothetical protein
VPQRFHLCRGLVIGALLGLLAACAPDATPEPPAPTHAEIEAQVRDLEQRQAAAALAGDRTVLLTIFAPHFRMISPVGAVATRDELLGILTGGNPPYRAATYPTETLDIYSDVVVTTGTEAVEYGPGAQQGQKQLRRVTQVWHRDGGSWWLVLRQATLGPAEYRPCAPPPGAARTCRWGCPASQVWAG